MELGIRIREIPLGEHIGDEMEDDVVLLTTWPCAASVGGSVIGTSIIIASAATNKKCSIDSTVSGDSIDSSVSINDPDPKEPKEPEGKVLWL